MTSPTGPEPSAEITPADNGLLNSTRAAMLSERSGQPLLPWQQQVLDMAFVAEATGQRLYLAMPRLVGRKAIAEAWNRAHDASPMS